MFCVQPAVRESLALMNEISEAATSLVDHGTKLREKLTVINQDLVAAKSDCKANGGGSVCDDIPPANITTEADFTKVCFHSTTYL